MSDRSGIAYVDGPRLRRALLEICHAGRGEYMRYGPRRGLVLPHGKGPPPEGRPWNRECAAAPGGQRLVFLPFRGFIDGGPRLIGAVGR